MSKGSEYQRALRLRRMAEGLCHCGREPLALNRTMGERCLARLRVRAARQRERARNGGTASAAWMVTPSPTYVRAANTQGRTVQNGLSHVSRGPLGPNLASRDTAGSEPARCQPTYTWPELVAMELERREQASADPEAK